MSETTDEKFTVVNIENEKPDLRKKEAPLVDLKVTNPITYIKSWWKKIIGNEGIELKVKVKPLTAIAIAIIVVTVSFGIGRFVLPFKIPFFEYSSTATDPTPIQSGLTPIQSGPTATPIIKEPRNTAFSGILKYDESKKKFYLFTVTSEAISLTVPTNINLTQLIGRRIFAAGKYNEDTRILDVENASDMEILPVKIIPVPTETPAPSPSVTATPTGF
jgi:hypothetical protein